MNFLARHLAPLLHAAYRAEKLAGGHPVKFEVNGLPYDLRHRWGELHEAHQAFDLRLTRRLLESLLNVRLWFG